MTVSSPRSQVTQRLSILTLDFSTDIREQVRQIATYLQSLGLGASFRLPQYTVSTVPTASEHTGGLVYVTDETGGAVPAFSDGTNWRRTTDRAVIS